MAWTPVKMNTMELLTVNQNISVATGSSMSDEITKERDVLDVLGDHEFLRGVSEETIREVAKLGTRIQFPSDTVIFRNDDPALNSYLIIEGRISLEICGPGVGCTRLMTIGNGDLLGCSPLLEQDKLTATARTLSPTQAIQLQGSEVVRRCEQNGRFGYEFMKCTAKAVAKRLTATRLQLLDMYREDTSTISPD